MQRFGPHSLKITHQDRPLRPPDIFTRFKAHAIHLHQCRPQLLTFRTPRPSGRWLSTAKREKYREQLRIFGKYSFLTNALLVCGTLVAYGAAQHVVEREKPTPQDWSFWSRTKFRSAFGQQKIEANPKGPIDWALIGSLYRQVLRRLEDPNIDGKDLVQQDDGSVAMPDESKIGYNLINKSLAWRCGYFETLMGCARSAEHLDGMLVDTTTNRVTKAHYVVGPSNPNPTPLPPWQKHAPLEENCKPASPPPEHYYVQILTTLGFTSRQRLDAAIAYADWLDFKGLPNTAEEMLNWAMDIAREGVPDSISVIDPTTHIVVEGPNRPSENLLTAATSLATHYAQTGDTARALPIYLSVLRALRAAPYRKWAPFLEDRTSTVAATDIEAIYLWGQGILKLIKDPPYPLPETTGDEPFERQGGDATPCDEAKLETYIGEILFATSSNSKRRAEAIRWTREAVEKATVPAENASMSTAIRLKCLACAEIGLSNWLTMARRLSEEEAESATHETDWTAGLVPRSWKRRFGLVTARMEKEDETNAGRWSSEVRETEARIAQVNRRGLKEKLTGTALAPFWAQVGWLMKV